jgi:O-antigen/teichoic acid export membrane protein
LGIIAKQGILNSVFSYFGVLLGFVSIVYIQPNFLKTSEIGLTRILVSFSFMAAIFIPLGIGSVTTRFFPQIRNAENKHHGHFFMIFLFCLIGSAILSLFFIIFKTNIIAYYQDKSPLFNEFYYLVFVFPFILALIMVYNIYSASLYKTVFTVFLNEVLIRVLQIAIVFIYYFGYFNLHQFMMAFVSVYLIQLLLLIIYIYKLDKFSFNINWSFYRTFFSNKVVLFSFLMVFTAFASIGIKMVDQVIMGHYLSLSSIGIYATSIFMVSIMEVPINSLERISNTIVANSWATNDIVNIKKIYYDSVRVLMLVGGYLMSGLICCSNSIFQLLPQEFEIGKNCMIVMAICSFFNLSTGINSTIIATSHKYFVISLFLFVLITTSVITNSLLIPKYGIIGSAYSTFISIGTYNLLKVIYLWYRLKMLPYNKTSLIILMTIIVSFTLIYFIPDNENPYLNILIKGFLITIIFIFSTIKFKLAQEITSKIPFLKNIKL